MTAQEKIAVIEYLKKHPDSTAKEIGQGCGLPPKVHSAALYSMKNTGLVLEKFPVGNCLYPVYCVNPEADVAELENPRLIYKRKRGPQTNHRIGIVEQRVLDALTAEPIFVKDLYDIVGRDVRMSYVRKSLNRLEHIGKAVHEGDDPKTAFWRRIE